LASRTIRILVPSRLPMITVPVPDHPEIRIGTLASIVRQSGVPRSEFEA
jgi:predicted RNA binding protein YcfA (HicA-like mRNA interferase family)